MVTRNKTASPYALGKQIKAQFSDGKWHSFETIVTKTGARAKKVWSVLDYMRRWGTYKIKCERKKVGAEHHFRLSPRDKQISVEEDGQVLAEATVSAQCESTGRCPG